MKFQKEEKEEKNSSARKGYNKSIKLWGEY
jgi:hypothetical protein